MTVQERNTKIEQFFVWSERPENKDRLFELINGEHVEKMVGYEASIIAGWILTYINLYLMQNQIGGATGADGAYIVSDDHVLIPDVGFISYERLPKDTKGTVPIPPDLAVEVKSPSDTKRELRRKAEIYIAHGTKMVWLVFPESQTIEVYIGKDEELTLGIDDTLSGGDVLPEFTVSVKDLFNVK